MTARKRRLRALRIVLALNVALLLASVLAAGSAGASGFGVSIVYRAFQPPNLTIDAGDTVTWTNRSLMAHTVTATAGMFDSGRLDAGASFSVAFPTPGTFIYGCTIHPTMKGRVTVRDPSLPPVGSETTGSLHASKLHVSSEPTAHGKLTLVHVQAPRPGAKALLEISSSGHPAWRTVAHTHLSAHGKATLSLRASTHGRARVVVLGPKGVPPLISRALRRAG
jgi:plastocyanin